MTTAQFFPRTPTDVMFAAVIALKAYSGAVSEALLYTPVGRSDPWRERTDLVETTLVGEDGNVSVIACASCTQRRLLAEARVSML